MDELTLYHWWQIVTGAGLIIASIAVAVVSFIQNKHGTAMDRISANHEKITSIHNTHSNRITAIESTMHNMPEYKNIEHLTEQVHHVDNKCSEMKGQLLGIQKKLSMIDQHLMSSK